MTRVAKKILVSALLFCAPAACEKRPASPLQTSAPVPAVPVEKATPLAAAAPSTPTPPNLTPSVVPTPSPLPDRAPLAPKELPTTDGEIAISNLEASLRSSEAFGKARPTDPIVHGNFVQLLCARGQYRGLLADYQRAEDLLPALIKIDPKEARSYLTRAQVRSIFHEFDAVLADLAQAEKLDKDLAPIIRERRASVLVATDKLDEALAIYRAVNAAHSDITTAGAEAALLGQRGELAAADALFIKAQGYFRDVTPFPLAWLYFQQGLMWEQHDNLARAAEFYAAAVERVPTYAAAVAHLAGAETARANRSAAINLLRPLVAASDDPEYKGQLAALLEQSGDAAGASKLLAEAKKSYQLLLAKHPRAFAAHAARFYLGPGKDAATAAIWADKNLAFLTTNDSLTLAVEAAAAAEKNAQACTHAATLIKRPYLLPRTHVIAARAFIACGKKDLADVELAAVKPAG